MCDNKVSEMKLLELLSVDEYYQTISTWMKILEEKNEAVNKSDNKNNDDGKQRRKLGKK